MKTQNYIQNLEALKSLAIKENTMFEINDYPRYNWTAIGFLTDKFGGCYLQIGIDYDGIIFNTEVPNRAKKMTINEIKNILPILHSEMLINRKLKI